MPEMIVITDSAGTIVGAAKFILERPDVVKIHPSLPKVIGWSGFARGSGQQKLSAFAIRTDGRTASAVGDYVTTQDKEP